MSTPDFSKIWGSNVSPENRYKFTDSAYLEGWSYIGSVPPAREAFDTLFRDIDTKMSYLNDELKNQSDSANKHDANAAAHNAMAATVDDTLAPTSDTNTIRNLISNLANRIKAATGAGGWKEAPAATLASLGTMIANLATGADVTWDGNKFTNHRLGITGLMDQNGYICFGPNCGNLIIQWGKLATKVETVNTVKPNIDCTILLVLPVASYDTCARSEPYPWVYATPDGSNMRILVDVDGTRLQDVGLDTDVFWFALGKN